MEKDEKSFPTLIYARQEGGNKEEIEKGTVLATSVSVEEVIESDEPFTWVAQYQLVGVRKYRMNAIEVK